MLPYGVVFALIAMDLDHKSQKGFSGYLLWHMIAG
jgi:hypothetical protein